VIGLSRKKSLGFQFGDVDVGGAELTLKLFQEVVFLLDVGFFLGKMDIRFYITGDGTKLLVSGNLFFGALALAENFLSGFLIAPEIGVGDTFFESFQALAILRRVKDSSGRE
jgi:hypothetical protein